MRSTRRVISAAARREKVISRDPGVGPVHNQVSDPGATVLVFPEPAPAMTRSALPGAAGAAGEPHDGLRGDDRHRHLVYSVPSRLIGHRLRVRL
jgi:hypothetical protein